jgi:2-polyprenyl-3-methyl-5-hydroxy-6-metoxy-1,4-benzoquinol methylase
MLSPRGICNVFDAAAYQRHFGRYRYFLPHIRTSDLVLDIACGSGYGSEILASKAKFVQGVDLDPETIKYAKRHHQKRNIRFDASSAERFLPKKRFDKVISIETIEHLADPEAFLSCVAGWLRPGGEVWLTCPFSGGEEQNIESPFHISELNRERLKAAMKGAFKDVKFFDLGGRGIFTVDTLKNKVTYIVAKGIKK